MNISVFLQYFSRKNNFDTIVTKTFTISYEIFLDIYKTENSRWGHFNNYQPGKYKQPLTHTKRSDHNGNKKTFCNIIIWQPRKHSPHFWGKMFCAKTENKITDQRIQLKRKHKQMCCDIPVSDIDFLLTPQWYCWRESQKRQPFSDIFDISILHEIFYLI